MEIWERFNEELLPDQKAFYSELKLQDITDEDYAHAQKMWNDFEPKDLDDYIDLYVQSNTLLLANVFENFRNMFIDIYELDLPHFLSATELAWEACFKKTKVKLELLTDYDILLMIEKGIRDGISQAIHRYATASNTYMKSYKKYTESSYLMHLEVNNLYGWAMSQKLPVNGFKWIKELSKFHESFIKGCDQNSDKGYFLEVDAEYPKSLFNLHRDLPFLPERKKMENAINLFAKLMTKKAMSFT